MDLFESLKEKKLAEKALKLFSLKELKPVY